MFALIQVKDSLAMRDGIIGNLLKTALSHILKSHIFAFAVSVFLLINSLTWKLDFPLFSLSDLLCNRVVI